MHRFQSALPRGERHNYHPFHRRQTSISIRAPARGATMSAAYLFVFRNSFQSALPRGERRCPLHTCLSFGTHFNPRSREGSDWYRQRYRYENDNFNPRSREGSDILVPKSQPQRVTISIRAPARGATYSSKKVLQFPCKFQSALPRGERRFSIHGTRHKGDISIRAPARGATSDA